MKRQGLWPTILRLVRDVSIGIVCIVVLAGLSCLPFAAWRTFRHFGNRVMILGAVTIVLGVGLPVVNTEAAGDLQYLMPTGSSAYQRVRQRIAYSMSSFGFTTMMVIAGALAALLGRLIWSAASVV